MIKIAVSSVLVEDQAEALAFYTEVLGFEKRQDFPVGANRWLTVASPAGPEGVELLLEPVTDELARTFQRGLYEAGRPATVFAVDDIQKEYARMKGLGVAFPVEPTPMGPVISAVFDDTCGNLINLSQVA